MARNSYKIKINAKKIGKDLSSFKATYPNMAKNYLIEKAAQAVRIGREMFTPVKTGNLKSTLRVLEENNKILFVSGGIDGKGKGGPIFVDYAGYVNYGTSRIEPRLFMERSAEKAANTQNDFADEALQSWLKFLK